MPLKEYGTLYSQIYAIYESFQTDTYSIVTIISYFTKMTY
jgi:hypothetical protein